MLYSQFYRYHQFCTMFTPPPDDDGDEGDEDEEKSKGGDGGDKGDGDPETPEALKKELQKWKGLARQHEKAANTGKEAIKKLKEMEDGSKSELTKAQEALAKHQTDLTAAQLELARVRVAIRKGLTESQAKRLVGETEEELEADADEFLKDIKPGGNGNSDSSDSRNRRTPRENLRRGNAGAGDDADDGENDPRKLAAAIPRR